MSTEPAETTESRIRPMKTIDSGIITEYKRSILICLKKLEIKLQIKNQTVKLTKY